MKKHPALNPSLPGWEYIPDGEPHVFGDRIYVYGSHDAPGGDNYCLGDYVCWSAPVSDPGAWSFEGTIYRKADDPSNRDGSRCMIAPDACQGPDGRYYLYYALAGFTTMGVAVCDTPGGHYHYLGEICFADGTPLTPQSGYGLPFDPAVYVEGEDVWFYYGFGVDYGFGVKSPLGGYVVKLGADMHTMISEPKLIAPGPVAAAGSAWETHPFFEASSMRKIGGRYYFVYSSTAGHELCYGIADAPDQAPAFGGVVISNGDVGLPGHETEEKAVNYLANNHGGLVEFGGQTYIFYHRHTHGTQYSRQGCAEPVQIGADGRIAQAEVTSCGLNGGPLPARGEYPAYIACALHGAKGVKHYSSRVKCGPEDVYVTQTKGVSGSDTEVYVANLQEGSGCGFKYFKFEGPCTLRLMLRGSLKGTVYVHLDSEDKAAAAVLPVELCGSTEKEAGKDDGECLYGKAAEGCPSGKAAVYSESGLGWQTAEAVLDAAPGTHALYLTFAGEGTCDLLSIGFEGGCA